jgi:peptide/nickel transport system substrate-binding protein
MEKSFDQLSRREAIALLAASAAIGIGPAQAQDTPPQPVRGGTMTLLFDREPTSLVSFADTNSLHVSAKVTEGLLWFNQAMEPQPQLSTAWTVSADGLSYEFKLRPNVKWHDGRDFTSADVAYSLMKIREVHPRARSTFAQLDRVETPDALTAILKLNRPVPYMIRALCAAETPIVPKHIYEGTDPASNANVRAPIGTGPFKFKEWVRGSHVVYLRNEAYWDQPRPYLDQLIIKFVPDAAASAVALETQSADATYRTLVPLNDVERLKKVPHLRFTQDGYAYSNNVIPITFNLDNPILSNVKVRQGLARAINRDVICRVVFYNMLAPNESPIAPFLKAYHDPTPGPWTFDVKAAEALLDEAGYPRGKDNVRFRMNFDVSPLTGESVRLGEFLRAAFNRVGVSLQLRSSDASAYSKRIYGDRDFEITASTISNLFDPTVGVQRLYWSKNIRKGVHASNGAGYRNARVDELLEAAAVELDEKKRREQFVEFQTIIKTEVPEYVIGVPVWTTIYNKRAWGHSVTADGLEGNMAHAFVVPG